MPDQRGEIAVPAAEEVVHVEDVVGADRRRVRMPVDLGDEGFVGEEPEGGAAARGALDLEEEEVLATGQEADALTGDALLADGAGDTVEELAQVILWIHPQRV